ncbi:tRNA-dihydrouridine synthase, partial [Candidatus Beckwithbacteria bacterium CG_4_10_14_0_2_um_filter_47_25]
MLNIWQQLKKPIWCLAPMFGATDSAFRQLLAEIGKPD